MSDASQDFRTSSYCTAGACVEVRSRGDGDVELRSSRDVSVIVTFTAVEWRSFLDGVKAGEFDHV